MSGNATLKLTDVTRTDAGQYTCIADNKVGTPARRAVTVSLLSEWSTLKIFYFFVTEGKYWHRSHYLCTDDCYIKLSGTAVLALG